MKSETNRQEKLLKPASFVGMKNGYGKRRESEKATQNRTPNKCIYVLLHKKRQSRVINQLTKTTECSCRTRNKEQLKRR